MKIVLTKFAIDSHFDSARAGTIISDRAPKDFERESCQLAVEGVWRDGYASFCKLVFIPNWTDAKAGTMPITVQNERHLRSEYKSRTSDELPVLVRWLEVRNQSRHPISPRAKYLGLVLYSKEQLAKEGTDIGDADYGIVAILGQMSDEEEPMTPMTAMRNALGVKAGGSGKPLDREAYLRSVEFWNTHATVKA